MKSNTHFDIDIKIKDIQYDTINAIKEEIDEMQNLKDKPKSLIEKSSKNLRLIKDLKTTFKKDIENMNDVI